MSSLLRTLKTEKIIYVAYLFIIMNNNNLLKINSHDLLTMPWFKIIKMNRIIITIKDFFS